MGYLSDRSLVGWVTCGIGQWSVCGPTVGCLSCLTSPLAMIIGHWNDMALRRWNILLYNYIHCQKKMILYIEHNQHSADEKHKLNFSCPKLKRFFLKTEKSQYLAWDGISGTNLNSVEWSQLFAFNFDTLCWNSVIVVPGLPPLSMMGQIHFCFRSTVAWMRVLYFVKGFKWKLSFWVSLSLKQ